MKYFIRYQGLWWRPDGRGYTSNILEAGLYSEERARSQASCNARALLGVGKAVRHGG